MPLVFPIRWSVTPAAIAGVHGRHTLAEPVPLVGSGTNSDWRKLAWGSTKFTRAFYLVFAPTELSAAGRDTTRRIASKYTLDYPRSFS